MRFIVSKLCVLQSFTHPQITTRRPSTTCIGKRMRTSPSGIQSSDKKKSLLDSTLRHISVSCNAQ
eukprot:4333814-Amphidinium_carterae.1